MKHLQRIDLLGQIGSRLQASYSTSQINSLLRSMGVVEGLVEMAPSKRVYAQEKLAVLNDEKLLALARELDIPLPSDATEEPLRTTNDTDHRTVFVIHGRNERLRSELFSFLRAVGLDPLEWSEAVRLTGKGAPYIGEVLDSAFAEAAAVVVLLTPDDVVHLSPELLLASDGPDEREDRLQPRPNVLFEAGMAFGRHPERTVLVCIGNPKAFSDVAGRHAVRLTNDPAKRFDLVGRLETAGCNVKAANRRDWLKAGDFSWEPTVRPSTSSGLDKTSITEQQVDILRSVAEQEVVTAKDLAEAMQISPIAAEHHLETLMEREFLYDQLAVGQPPTYLLDKKGRALLVERGLA